MSLQAKSLVHVAVGLVAILATPVFADHDDRDDPECPPGRCGKVEKLVGTSLMRYQVRDTVCLHNGGRSKCYPDWYLGDRYVIPLPDAAAIESVTIYARDDVGNYHRAGIGVWLDREPLHHDAFIDVESYGSRLSFDHLNRPAQELVIEELRGDEVVITAVEIDYLPRHREYYERPGFDDEEICIGGRRCGDWGRSWTVPLDRRAIEEVVFFAHDDVGNRGKARLRVRIDDHVLASSLDIKKAGRLHRLDARGLRGRELIFEVINDDEVVLDDINVRYRRH